jgi:heparanase 1
LQFASEVGFKVVLGLNGCYGRTSANSSMDFSNIVALLSATANSPYVSALWGFEFTNEVVPKTIDPQTWVKDIVKVKSKAYSIFKAKGLPLPLFAGPDQGLCSPIAQVAQYLPRGTLESYTYHQYTECVAPLPGPDGFVFEPSCLSGVDGMASECVGAATNSKGGPPYPGVWCGESADHYGSGIANLTDTFRSSFYYAWQLGAQPANGVELTARQCLSGGDYELLQKESFVPNPDYYIVWLFHKLIGGGSDAYVVNHTIPWMSSGVRVFAFSASSQTNADITLLVINLQDGTAGGPITIQLVGELSGVGRTEYHLTGDVTAEHGPIFVNGNILAVSRSTNRPPPWQTLGKYQTGPLVIAPSSIVFATVKL